MQGFRYILYRDLTLFHGSLFYKIKDMYLGHTMQTLRERLRKFIGVSTNILTT